LSPVTQPFEGPSNSTLQRPAKRQRRTEKEVHTTEYLEQKKRVADVLYERVTAWLQEQAKGQPEYNFDTLKEVKNKRLQNTEIVKSWKFVAAFAKTHVDNYPDVPVCFVTS